MRVAPDNEWLVPVALSGECNDVVGALQLREGVAVGVPAQFHAACARLAVHHPCTSDNMLQLKNLLATAQLDIPFHSNLVNTKLVFIEPGLRLVCAH